MRSLKVAILVLQAMNDTAVVMIWQFRIEPTDAARAPGVSFHPSIPTEKGRRMNAERMVMIENRLRRMRHACVGCEI